MTFEEALAQHEEQQGRKLTESEVQIAKQFFIIGRIEALKQELEAMERELGKVVDGE